MSDGPAIRFDHVSKMYHMHAGMGTLLSMIPGLHRRGHDEFWALKDVSFEVQPGECLGIIGPNGAGKSTVLKILSRITPPTTGRYEVRGRLSSLIEVGAGFHPDLTGRENIYLNAAILGMSRKETDARFDEIIDFSGLGEFIDVPVKRYSSGMYVRLGFAVAAHLVTEILLVDEVLAVGDVEFQRKCLGKMGEVGKDGRTVIFVSHNMAAVQAMCQRAVLLLRGECRTQGPAREVVDEYISSAQATHSGSVDVTAADLRRNSLPDSLFKWTRVSILGRDGRPAESVRLREPFTIVLEAHASGRVHDLHAGMTILAQGSTPVFSTFQTDSGLPREVDAGPITYRVHLDPNLLGPGIYEISLGANGPGVTDWIPYACRFNVTTSSADGKESWEDFRGGILRYPVSWERVNG